ncbi:PucR family transcriptional regulator [Pseudonocardiaceae bacterium YIM PH 21723]|nr:PucR family transcriptional regulator [Pseudonocardiaceae bacterium YIM PH 21723]
METGNWDNLVAELLARRAEIADRLLTHMRETSPAYARLPEDELRRANSEAYRCIMLAFAERRMLSEADLSRLREFGAFRSAQGIQLDELLTGFRIDMRENLAMLTELGRKYGFTESDLIELNHYAIDLNDQAAAAIGAGFRQTEPLDQRRDRFAHDVLLGVATEFDRYGVEPDGHYVPFRLAGTDHALLRRLTAGGRIALVTTIDGDHAGFADVINGRDVEVPVGLGPAVRPERLPAAFARATRALRTAVAFGRTGAVEQAELALLPAVLAEAEIGDDLMRRYLPAEVDEVLLATLRAHLAGGMRVEETAARLIVHPNTVRYRISRYQQITGFDPRDPDSMAELWWALRRSELGAG